MNKYTFIFIISIAILATTLFINSALAKPKQQSGYILEHEASLAKKEPAPHNGNGNTTAYNFFDSAMKSKLVFRKRVLHPGSDIGYHLQEEEEIYYIVSGKGEMKMNNEVFEVNAGDAILTLPGSSHGLKQKGDKDLVVIINYERTTP